VDFLLIGYIKLFAIFFFTYRNTVCKWVVVTRIWLSAPAQEKEKHNADKDCDVDCAPRKLFHKNKTARRIMPAVERKKPTAGPVSRRHTSFPIWPVKLPHDGFFKLHWACHSCLMLVARGRAFLFNCSPTVAPNYFYATTGNAVNSGTGMLFTEMSLELLVQVYGAYRQANFLMLLFLFHGLF